MKILLATKNRGKVREFNEIFRDLPIEFVGLEDVLEKIPEVIEDGRNFRENAEKKALTYYKVSGMPTLSEDSGLEVNALGGAPGVYSARFAGKNATDEKNIEKLLMLLKNVPLEKRTARFVSVICFVMEGSPYFFEGTVRGRIALSPRGTHGFGYDPVFIPEGYDKTFGELGPEVKNRISHRAKALEKFRRFLSSIL